MVVNKKGISVLIVDDDSDIIMLMSKILKAEGHFPIASLSLDDGKENFLEIAPHVVLLDIRLGNKSGFEFLQWKQTLTEYRDIPVIMMSLLKDRASIYKAIQLGAKDYLIKPVDAAKLLQKVSFRQW